MLHKKLKLNDANKEQFVTFEPPPPPPMPLLPRCSSLPLSSHEKQPSIEEVDLPPPPPLPQFSQWPLLPSFSALSEVQAVAVQNDTVNEKTVEEIEAEEQRSYMSEFEKLQRAAEVESYRIGSLQHAMETCFFPPLLGIDAFLVEKHVFEDTFIREDLVNKMSSQEKEKYKTVFKQTHVLEILGACGYMSSTFMQNDKKYRLFHWSGYFAAKWAYRFATNLDKTKKITVMEETKTRQRSYRKIRCPNVLYQHLLKYFESERLSDLKKSFIKQAGFTFMSKNDLCKKLKEPSYFFPFKNLEYDDQIVKNLFRMYDDAADNDELINWQTLDLHLTHKAQVNITLLYTWIKQAYETGILTIGRLR